MSSDQSLKISIAMATYNGAKYLTEQLASFLGQTRLPDELVITDDCSNDATLEIIKKFRSEAPFNILLIVNESRLGFSLNFSKAISLCSGDLIFLSDQDDVWFPSKIQDIARIANQRSDMSVFINDAFLTYDNLNRVSGSMIDRRLSEGLSLATHLTNGCQTAVRRSFALMMIPIPESVHAHDIWIHDFARYLGVKLIVPKVLQYWRRHEKSTCGFPALKPSIILRMKRLSHHFLHGYESPASALEEKKSYLLLLLNHLNKYSLCLDQWRVIGAQRLIHHEIYLNDARLQSLKNNGFSRLVSIWVNYFKGVYKLEGGFKTAIRDFFSATDSAGKGPLL